MRKKPLPVVNDTPVEEIAKPAVEIEPVTLGGRLRKAREHLGLTVEEAALKLCLSARQLMALEADDIGALPSPTFTRGFIRNYARLLKLDAEPLLVMYNAMLPQSAAGSSISLHSEGIPILVGNRSSWLPYLLASVLLGVAVGGWWAYMDWRENASVQSASAEKSTVAEAPAPAAPEVSVPAAPVEPQPADTVMAPPSEPSAASPVVVPPALPAPAPSAAVAQPIAAPAASVPTQTSASGSRIVMKFTQPSWVRVSDRDNKVMMHGNQPENTEQVIEGNPPFKVEVGNAAGVQLNYNGQPVDLAPHTKSNVARLTLE
jgi:cytoskeleton protein RodZ